MTWWYAFSVHIMTICALCIFVVLAIDDTNATEEIERELGARTMNLREELFHSRLLLLPRDVHLGLYHAKIKCVTFISALGASGHTRVHRPGVHDDDSLESEWGGGGTACMY